MITEQELELALTLRNNIKDLKILIAKVEPVVVSDTQNLNNGVSVDNSKMQVNSHTRDILIKFKDDIVLAHKLRLAELEERYKEIIEAPSDTLRRILEENG